MKKIIAKQEIFPDLFNKKCQDISEMIKSASRVISVNEYQEILSKSDGMEIIYYKESDIKGEYLMMMSSGDEIYSFLRRDGWLDVNKNTTKNVVVDNISNINDK